MVVLGQVVAAVLVVRSVTEVAALVDVAARKTNERGLQPDERVLVEKLRRLMAAPDFLDRSLTSQSAT